MGVVAGPFVFFEDYMSFIEGRNFNSKQVSRIWNDTVTQLVSFMLSSVFQTDRSEDHEPAYLVSHC